jgi:hypothetical protein
MPSPADATTLQAYGEEIQKLHQAAQAKWGFERLEMLVSPELRAKFRRTRMSWVTALQAAWDAEMVTRDMLQLVVEKCASMTKGYAALDAAAEEAGARPVAPWVWEVPLPDGSVAALVQTDAEASKVIADGRHVQVYTAQEIGNLIGMLVPESLKLAKIHFPGAKFEAASLGPVDRSWVKGGDPMPDFTAGRAA